jgi:hypothetical protein
VAAALGKEGNLDILYPRCASLGVHKDTVVATAGIVAAGAVCLFDRAGL